MSRRPLLVLSLLTSASLVTPGALAERRPHAGMMRNPDVSKSHIVFAYANDLWIVPRTGGEARPLASPPGPEGWPRFSADGQTVAFCGNYDGNRDIYTVPLDGGVPTRVTHHPAGEVLCDWTPDGQLLFFASAYGGLARQDDMLTVPATGGMPARVPVPYGAFGAISPDGTWLAYTPHTYDSATWKRYCGGMATDIWLFNLKDHSSKRITTFAGSDSQPMWQGSKLYYLSDDGPQHRRNIWMYNLTSGERKQVTQFADFDVKWPAIGPGPLGSGEIVFQCGKDIYLLDLTTEQARAVEITVPGDLPLIRPQRVDVKGQITAGDVSATGKRAVFEARGDIWSAPAHNGSPRNLTRTSGVAERQPAWSPDGRWIAYFSDESGEYELYIMQSDGRGAPRRVTKDGSCFRYNPSWSPDSKLILFGDKTGALFLCTAETGTVKLVDQDPWGNMPNASWAPDSRWIVYPRTSESMQTALWLYSVPTGEKHQLTSGMFNDSWPTFDRKGDYLFFASNRRFDEPIYEDLGSTFIYTGTDQLAVVPLRERVGSPFAPRSDEESWKDDKKKDDEAGKEKEKSDGAESAESKPTDTAAAESKPADTQASEADKKADEEVTPIEIELAGFEQRAILIPVKHGSFSNLAVNHENKLLYVRNAPRGAREEKPAIKIFDPTADEPEEKTVLDGSGPFAISADGKKLMVRSGDTFAIVDAAAGQKFEKTVPLDGLAAVVNPREEWRQLLLEAWRLQRDYFYVANMHGLNWGQVRDHYMAMLDDCVSRADVAFLIRELISELNIGHAYYWGNDTGDEPSVPTGLLGCDFALENGGFRITRFIQGGPWDLDAKGPLSQPGMNVKPGDYLVAVNGVKVDTSEDPWAAFQGLAPGQVVTITVNDQPEFDAALALALTSKPAETKEGDKDSKDKKKDEPKARDKDRPELTRTGQRDVLVKLIGLGTEMELRYRAWVEQNRAYVAQKTNGQVGYIHVPSTGIDGQNELFRQFFGQRHKAALIIDERWNSGGQIPTRFIELLNRPLRNFWKRRDGKNWPSPEDAHQGPKCMLINGLAGSGGDCFPYYFRQSQLGKLIGMRTWGGLVGISGNPGLIDGAVVTVPTFGFFELDGTWGVEGHGVDPDIEVIDDPALMVNGGDPQLDKGIEVMLAEVAAHPFVPTKTPADPDRSGMGIRPEDR